MPWSGKTEWTHWNAFHWICCTTKYESSPFYAHADFEKALINAARSQFPNTLIIWRLFHFKQAIFRCLKKIGVNPEQIQMVIEQNCVDSLTIIQKKKQSYVELLT